MNEESATEQTETQTNEDKPGRLLRETRLQKQLTIEEIRKRINLEGRIIEAIEADDYSNITSPTYVRGYLRSYAKAVDLDGDYVVSLFQSENMPPPPEILPEVKPPSQVSSNDKPVKAFTYLLILALILLLLVWYQGNFLVSNEQTEEITGADETETSINNTDTGFDVVIHPEGWQSPTTENAERIQTETVAVIEQDTDETMTSMETSQVRTENGMAMELNLNETNIEESATSETIEYISDGSDTILLTITDESWIEVYDANEERLFMNLGKEGEKINIQGQAPFRIILGYSPGVDLIFNDERFDTEPFSNDGVARFRIPIQ
ncbi:MAG: RodZ domain-containing protein [Pseudomonadota bacterium]